MATTTSTTPQQLRERLLRGVPVVERRLDAAGVPTVVLEGGAGAPVVLLHGPGESAVNWRWTIPDLITTHRVIAPDLPAHGSSGTGDRPLDAERAIDWLAALIEATCDEPPTVVGHVLGGALAARFAVRSPGRLRRLVLVDSLGLARFRPRAGFALGLLRFQARPRKRSYERFMDQCAYDLDALRHDLSEDWATFVTYNVELATSPSAGAARSVFRTTGLPRIPAEQLDHIEVPTTLIWGSDDRANPVAIAEKVSARHGWPLHVIERAADDPARDRPAAFLEALRSALSDHRADSGSEFPEIDVCRR